MSKAKELIKKFGIQEASDKLENQEDNDCVVRALMHTLGITYAESHHLCETKLNRKPGYGVFTNVYLPKVKQAYGKKIKQLGKPSNFVNGFKTLTRTKKTKQQKWSNTKQKYVTKRVEVQVPYKVKEFIKEYPTGNYFVTVRGHAISIIDSQIIGNWNDGEKINREIQSAYKIG
jgi:hypothetical protein